MPFGLCFRRLTRKITLHSFCQTDMIYCPENVVSSADIAGSKDGSHFCLFLAKREVCGKVSTIQSLQRNQVRVKGMSGTMILLAP